MIQIMNTYGEMLLLAMGETLKLALSGLFFGCVLGVFFGLFSVVDNIISKAIAAIYVNLIRGVPMIVLAFFIYYGAPFAINAILGTPLVEEILSWNFVQDFFNADFIVDLLSERTIKGIYTARFTFSPLQAGTICLALNCGAYMSEIIRAGIQSIDPGQMEAARSLGLSYWRSMFRVVLPQAIKNMIPSIVNQFIITLKDTSILTVIGYPELVNKAQNVIAITFKSFETWIIVGVMYLVVILALQQVANALERSLNRGRR